MYSQFRISLLSLLLLSPFCSAYYDEQYQQVFADSKGVFGAIRHSLENSSIIPEVLDDFTPKCVLSPYYGKKHRSVTLGNAIKPSKVQVPPSLKIYCPGLETMSGLNLTVVLTDPDAPSREDPRWSEVCHWIAVIYIDGKGRDGMELSVGKGGVDDVVEYKPPGPPPKTGFHRYVFALLQGANLNLTAPEERRNWGTGNEGSGIRAWAKAEGLEVIGANFFVSKNKK